jgi:hypothetical protein
LTHSVGNAGVTANSEGDTLRVRLPPSLVVLNRRELIDTVQNNLRPGIHRHLSLDASGLEEIDSAGVGALACVVRMSIDVTDEAPELAGATDLIKDALRSVLLLRHFRIDS